MDEALKSKNKFDAAKLVGNLPRLTNMPTCKVGGDNLPNNTRLADIPTCRICPRLVTSPSSSVNNLPNVGRHAYLPKAFLIAYAKDRFPYLSTHTHTHIYIYIHTYIYKHTILTFCTNDYT